MSAHKNNPNDKETKEAFAGKRTPESLDRRTLLKGAGLLAAVGACSSCAIGSRPLVEGRPAVGAEELNGMVQRALNMPRFNCALIRPADEGPFYNPASLLRRNIIEGHPGVPLRLRIGLGGLAIASPSECIPLRGAMVDIWHADAEGQYSNVGDGIQDVATPGETFLRGHQMTDDSGFVEFDTIVPGWEVIAVTPPINMAARTTHIHVKIYHEWQVFDTQLYLPDELIDALYGEVEPYRSRNVIRVPGSDQQVTRLRNADDELFQRSQSTPMSIERVDGVLVATAAIGTLGSPRGLPSLYRGG